VESKRLPAAKPQALRTTNYIEGHTIWMSLQLKRNPILPKDGVVDVAGRWGKGYYSYPGRV